MTAHAVTEGLPNAFTRAASSARPLFFSREARSAASGLRHRGRGWFGGPGQAHGPPDDLSAARGLLVIDVRLRETRRLRERGMLEVEDAETGRHLLVDTFSRLVRQTFSADAERRRMALRQLARASRVDLIEVTK